MRRLLIVVLLLSFVAIVNGCSRVDMVYDGKVRPISEVEEIIADKLEVENPDLDLKVSITSEVDDN